MASGKRALASKRQRTRRETEKERGKERGGARSGSGGMPSVHSRLHILLSYFSRSIPLSFLSFAPFLSSPRKSIFFPPFFLYSYLFPFRPISFSLSIFLLLLVPPFPVALLHTAPPSPGKAIFLPLSSRCLSPSLSVPSPVYIYMLASRVPSYPSFSFSFSYYTPLLPSRSRSLPFS